MKKIITVCILDANRFFALGIKLILLSYFELRGQGVFFVGEDSVARADLVFWSARYGLPGQLCQQASLGSGQFTAFIVVRSGLGDKLSCRRCRCEQGTLWRGASPKSLLALVEKGLRAKDTSKPQMQTSSCSSCATLSLTRREQDVMSCMSWEMAPKSVPLYLNLSPKTVSAHKRAVMRKLGFKRNEELYHWLRNGGLEQLKRPLP